MPANPMAGATKALKKRIEAAATADGEYDEIVGLAQRVIQAMPDPAGRFGSMKSAMFLAATAYGEFGTAAAVAMVAEEKRNRKGFRTAKRKTKRQRGMP